MKKQLITLCKRILTFLEPRWEFAEAEMRMDIGTKAFYAQQMLSNPIYKELILRIEAETVDLWKSSSSLEDRERLHVHFMVLKQFNDYCKRYVTDQMVKSVRENENIQV